MELIVHPFLDAAFDNIQELKNMKIADKRSCVKYNDIEYNVGAYNADQKDLFIKIFNILNCYNETSLEDELSPILDVLNGQVSREQLYLIYDNAVDVAIQNRAAYGQKTVDKKDAYWLNDDKFNRVLDSTRKVKKLVK